MFKYLQKPYQEINHRKIKYIQKMLVLLMLSY